MMSRRLHQKFFVLLLAPFAFQLPRHGVLHSVLHGGPSSPAVLTFGQLLALLLVLLANSGCEPANPDYFGTVKPKHGPEELWVNNGAEPEWLDPNKCSDSNGGDIIWNTFAGLVEAHPQSLAPMPDIAKRWDVSDDGRTYTFHLRESVWSDGRPLTAHDFEYSFRRILDYRTASKYATNGYIFKNGAFANLRGLVVRGLPESATVEQLVAWTGDVPVKKHTLVGNGVAHMFVKTAEDLALEAEAAASADDASNEAADAAEPKPVDRVAIATLLSDRPFADTQTKVTVEVAGLDMVGVRVIDDLTLQVELENPIPYFLQFLTFYSFMPIPRHAIEALEAEGKNPDLWTRPENIVCNGAFRMTEWKFRQYMVFEKNEKYWNADIVKLKRVRASMIESYNTALNMYNAGEIDWPGGNTSLPAEFMDHLKQYKDFRYSPYLAEYFYWVNTKRPPMDNPKLRRAMSLAIDRQALVDYVARGNQVPTQDLVPDKLAGYEGLNRPIFDPDAARVLLKQAGYEKGSDVPPITLIYNTSEGHKQIAEAVQQMWKKELGIRVNIENQEWKVYLKNAEMMNFQIARMGWIGDYADPYTFLELLTTECGNNHSNWSNAQYDELMKQANAEPDKTKRLALMREGEAMAMEQQPLIPLYVYTRTQMVKPYVRGIWGNFQDRHLWKYIWIDEQYYDGVPEKPADDPPPPEPDARADDAEPKSTAPAP